MAHLAIKPLTTQEDTAVTEAWEEVVDPSSKKRYFYNRLTGQSRGSMPDSMKAARDSAPTGGYVPGTKVKSAPDPQSLDPSRISHASLCIMPRPIPRPLQAYNDRRKVLAGTGIAEWEAVADVAQGNIYYQNNITGVTEWEMPEAMDTLGRLPKLKLMKVNDNTLRRLPESFSLLESLVTLEAKNNYLEVLPAGIGELQQLRTLKVQTNEISDLPPSMGKLKDLTELYLTSNRIDKLPPFVGHMLELRKLMVGNNSLVELPPKIGYLKKLQELEVYNNPLEQPPYEQINEGMEKLLWSLRQVYLSVVNGPPPEMRPHFYGLANEKIELEPEFNARVAATIDKSAMNKELTLELQGLRKVPQRISQLEGLRVLKLSANNLTDGPPTFPKSLSSLTVLWLKSCKIEELDKSIGSLNQLRDLNLEDNMITELPSHFCRCRKIEHLNLSRNRLFELPEKIGQLTGLKELLCDVNRLDLLPKSFQSLRHLHTFSACMNCLYELPDFITRLEKLKILNLDANELHRLPKGMGNLKLTMLKCAHNRLEKLEPDFLFPNLAENIECLWVSNNNMLELPAMFNNVGNLRELHLDYNPLRSPPPELLAEKMEVIVQYCRIRAERVKEMLNLLVDEYGFDAEPLNFTPIARDCLTGNTG